MESQKISKYIKEINRLYNECSNDDPQFEMNLSKIIETSEDILKNRKGITDDERILFLRLISEVDKKTNSNIVNSMLNYWRDGMKYLKEKERSDVKKALLKVIKSREIDGHERMVTSMSLYNMGYLDICYEAMEHLACEDELDLKIRLDCVKFIFSSESKRDLAQECLISIIENDKYSCKDRYTAIADYATNKGIRTSYNFQKILEPYDEDFVYSIQYNFFHNAKNDLNYRVLSGQNLLQMSCLESDTKAEIINFLFEVSNSETNEHSLRADAIDVVYRLGTKEQKIQARKIITKLGFSAEGRLKRVLGTIYDNSMNMHDEVIEGTAFSYVLKVTSNTDRQYELLSYDAVKDQIFQFLKSYYSENAFDRNKALAAMHHIHIDTAVFTSDHVTNAEFMCHVWSMINSNMYTSDQKTELKKLMAQELVCMESYCSSNFMIRFVNVMSLVDDTIQISWSDQIIANFSGRMNAKIRDCGDSDLYDTLTLGMMKNADESDRKTYIDYIESHMTGIIKDLRNEFVDNGFVKDDLFSECISTIKETWLLAEKK